MRTATCLPYVGSGGSFQQTHGIDDLGEVAGVEHTGGVAKVVLMTEAHLHLAEVWARARCRIEIPGPLPLPRAACGCLVSLAPPHGGETAFDFYKNVDS